MLRIVESTDRSASTNTSYSSVLVSVLLHGLIALVLWCIVYNAFKRESISLTASSASTSGDTAFALVPEANPVAPPEAPGPSSWVESTMQIESLIAESMESDSLSEAVRFNYEPASVEFFGTRAYGNRFVFVLDISYSMKARDGERFQRACDELLRSVSALRSGQAYYVFAFCWDTENMFRQPAIEYATVKPGHVDDLRRWIYGVSLGPGTDPRRALALSHQLKPDAVFLLSDGHFNEPSASKTDTGWIDEEGTPFDAGVQEGVELLFRETPIHTIAFENPFTVAAMQKIATATNASFRYVKTRSFEPIDQSRFVSALRHIDRKHRQDRKPLGEYLTRLSYAREFIRDGELAYAEYLMRPLRHAKPSLIQNPDLLSQILTVLENELGGRRLEDFQPLPELATILGEDS